ncbi:hypothetical protein CHS0354_030745 [Potamilus streckersoni]|uniref:Uncharacterized protein n=1 Tax=Potamilus streckersoni TaxID=2493646 RepID=A0AAE0WCH5_9BIVA|nr:hypothetical protein CHS0354_030745 [Potamilus streckersoni]
MATSFHGTIRSILQHPSPDNKDDMCEPIQLREGTLKTIPELQELFTFNHLPLQRGSKFTFISIPNLSFVYVMYYVTKTMWAMLLVYPHQLTVHLTRKVRNRKPASPVVCCDIAHSFAIVKHVIDQKRLTTRKKQSSKVTEEPWHFDGLTVIGPWVSKLVAEYAVALVVEDANQNSNQ